MIDLIDLCLIISDFSLIDSYFLSKLDVGVGDTLNFQFELVYLKLVYSYLLSETVYSDIDVCNFSLVGVNFTLVNGYLVGKLIYDDIQSVYLYFV